MSDTVHFEVDEKRYQRTWGQPGFREFTVAALACGAHEWRDHHRNRQPHNVTCGSCKRTKAYADALGLDHAKLAALRAIQATGEGAVEDYAREAWGLEDT